jgi:hypothetical protein
VPPTDDPLKTLADLANLIGQRQQEVRRLLGVAVDAVTLKLNEIDRLMAAAGTLINDLRAAFPQGD